MATVTSQEPITLLEGLGLTPGDPANATLAIRERWEHSTSGEGRLAPIGFEVDDQRNKPTGENIYPGGGPGDAHMILGGGTGTGKSYLLQGYIASLAATYSPEHINFALYDFKGGAAFRWFADLPHVKHLGDMLGASADEAAARLINFLQDSHLRREDILRQARAEDINEYNATVEEPLPRLIVVLCEFRELVGWVSGEIHDELLDALKSALATGRSLGIHIILESQVPDFLDLPSRANINTGVSFRLSSSAWSSTILGVPDAASLPPTRVALMRSQVVDGTQLSRFQGFHHRVEVPGTEGLTQLEWLVERIGEAAAQ